MTLAHYAACIPLVDGRLILPPLGRALHRPLAWALPAPNGEFVYCHAIRPDVVYVPGTISALCTPDDLAPFDPTADVRPPMTKHIHPMKLAAYMDRYWAKRRRRDREQMTAWLTYITTHGIPPIFEGYSEVVPPSPDEV